MGRVSHLNTKILCVYMIIYIYMNCISTCVWWYIYTRICMVYLQWSTCKCIYIYIWLYIMYACIWYIFERSTLLPSYVGVQKRPCFLSRQALEKKRRPRFTRFCEVQKHLWKLDIYVYIYIYGVVGYTTQLIPNIIYHWPTKTYIFRGFLW